VPEISRNSIVVFIVHGYFIYYKCVNGQVFESAEILGNSYYYCQSEKNEKMKKKEDK